MYKNKSLFPVPSNVFRTHPTHYAVDPVGTDLPASIRSNVHARYKVNFCWAETQSRGGLLDPGRDQDKKKHLRFFSRVRSVQKYKIPYPGNAYVRAGATLFGVLLSTFMDNR